MIIPDVKQIMLALRVDGWLRGDISFQAVVGAATAIADGFGSCRAAGLLHETMDQGDQGWSRVTQVVPPPGFHLQPRVTLIMAKLIYSAITSLDGYVADRNGAWDWCAPDEEVHHAVNEIERSVGTHLYGRRMYEVLVAWETMDTGQGRAIQDFAEIWRAADKVVYSRTLESASSERTRIERDFDPDAVRQMKRCAQRDISVGGPASPPRRSRPRWSTSCTCSSRP